MIRPHIRLLPALAGLLTGLLGTACASGPYTARLLTQGGPRLNPTFDDEPSAVNIRVLPLIDREAFDNAENDELEAEEPKLPANAWEPPHKEAVVYVGKQAMVEVTVKPKVKFLGIYGIFNEATGENRLVVSVDDIADKKLVFDNFAIQLQDRQEGDVE